MAPHERTLNLAGWTTVGIDMDASAIARHTGLRLRVLGNIERLPFRDRTFNLITANMVLEHVEAPDALFAEISRVLADDGMLLVHTPNADGYTTKLTRLLPQALIVPLAGLLLHRAPADVFQTFYRANSVDALTALARFAKLTPVSFRYVASSPQLMRVPPLLAIERRLIRLLQRSALAKYRPCIIATFARSRIDPTLVSQ
jgi:SAM-dependent methyltransferase